MNIRNFDLNLLIIFNTLFEERNVTKASKKVGITQPAMSNALNRLRYLVKDELFVRGPKGMRPTPRAIELAIPIKAALNSIENSLSSVNFNPETTKKLYRISLSDDVAPLVVPNLVNFLHKKSPQSSLRIRSEQGSEALKLLDNNDIDFAIGRFELVPNRFQSLELFTEKYVCMMNGDHVLKKEKKLSIKQYLSSKHLRVAPTGSPVAPIDRSLGQLNLEREIFARIDSMTMAPLILKNSFLLLTLPSKTAQRIANNYNFVIAELPIELEKRQTKLVWHAELSNHPSFDWVKKQIRIDIS